MGARQAGRPPSPEFAKISEQELNPAKVRQMRLAFLGAKLELLLPRVESAGGGIAGNFARGDHGYRVIALGGERRWQLVSVGVGLVAERGTDVEGANACVITVEANPFDSAQGAEVLAHGVVCDVVVSEADEQRV